MNMKYALIKNGQVDSVILADSVFIEKIKDNCEVVLELPEGSDTSAGWLYDGVNFKRPHQEVVITEVACVQMRQFKLALLKKGKLQAFQNCINTSISPIKEEVEIEWQYATVIQKDNALCKLLEQVDLNVNEFMTYASAF